MNHTTDNISAHRDGVVQSVDGEAGLHPRIDRVSDDLVREHVFHRAEIELALGSGPVFGDVRQPELVRALGAELVPDATVRVGYGAEVVVDRGAGFLAIAASFLPESAPPRVVATDPPRRPVCHRLTGLTCFVREEPVSELWIVLVGIE